MLNGDDNENGFKTNRSNQQKNKLHVQHTFSSNQQKGNLHVQHTFLSFTGRCFARLQRCFVRLKRTQYFVSYVHVRFYFSPPLIFTFLVASISHFLTATRFFFLRNSSPLFSITRPSSFSVIHVSVSYIKNNVEKDTNLLLLFLSKSPGGHVISFQIKP